MRGTDSQFSLKFVVSQYTIVLCCVFAKQDTTSTSTNEEGVDYNIIPHTQLRTGSFLIQEPDNLAKYFRAYISRQHNAFYKQIAF
jgi:hypothetical protein